MKRPLAEAAPGYGSSGEGRRLGGSSRRPNRPPGAREGRSGGTEPIPATDVGRANAVHAPGVHNATMQTSSTAPRTLSRQPGSMASSSRTIDGPRANLVAERADARARHLRYSGRARSPTHEAAPPPASASTAPAGARRAAPAIRDPSGPPFSRPGASCAASSQQRRELLEGQPGLSQDAAEGPRLQHLAGMDGNRRDHGLVSSL